MNEPKCRPILFSAPMVRAILEGRKTQTRREVKGSIALEWLDPSIGFSPAYVALPENKLCPYGAPGDLLWIKETWSPWASEGTKRACAIGDAQFGNPTYPAIYRADYRVGCNSADVGGDGRWRPSIHMPRKLSRITLEVTGVRVERLQDISEGDALAEGIQLIAGRYTFNGGLHQSRTPQEAFFALIDAIHGEGTAALNPWVWVVEFRRVEVAP